MSDIPEAWIKSYVDQLIAAAQLLDPGSFRDAILLRADNAMDLVKAWRQHKKAAIPASSEAAK